MDDVADGHALRSVSHSLPTRAPSGDASVEESSLAWIRHASVMDSLFGSNGSLWRACPEMALVLLVAIASAAPEIVSARNKVAALLFHSVAPPLNYGFHATLVHTDVPVRPLPGHMIYIGCGVTDPQYRPSLFFNPY